MKKSERIAHILLQTNLYKCKDTQVSKSSGEIVQLEFNKRDISVHVHSFTACARSSMMDVKQCKISLTVFVYRQFIEQVINNKGKAVNTYY